MFRRKSWFILIPTMLLIPFLVGMIPLKLANKMAHGGTCTHSESKQGNSGQKNCFAHSLLSQNHFDIEIVNASFADHKLFHCREALGKVSESIHYKAQPTAIPLRC